MPKYYERGGRARVRVRETYVRDTLAPLLSRRASGVAKTDLVLRGLASLEAEGLLNVEVSWEDIHDLVRPGEYYGDATKLKRNWVGEKLERLEAENLLARTKSPGGRSRLRVLRDDGSAEPLDDPGSIGEGYVAVSGDLFQFERIALWGSPEVSAYFAATIAERFARHASDTASINADRPWGGGLWFRELQWFADPRGQRPEHHVRVPFSERTLRRGFVSLRRQALVATVRIHRDPRTGQPFRQAQGRYLYQNGFADMRPGRGVRSQELARLAKRLELLR
jgi:hypothetical protein